MRVEMLIADFYLPGCHSLKDKRRRLSGLRERFGRQTNLAVSETNYQDDHQRGQYTFVAVGAGHDIVDRVLESVEVYLDEEVDANIVGLEREIL